VGRCECYGCISRISFNSRHSILKVSLCVLYLTNFSKVVKLRTFYFCEGDDVEEKAAEQQVDAVFPIKVFPGIKETLAKSAVDNEAFVSFLRNGPLISGKFFGRFW
jgi:hypothetical protein